MYDQNTQYVNYYRKLWPGLRPEFPQPAEWDQLLTRLGVDDSEALEAVKSDGNEGEQLRKFVLRSFRDHFVPEAVIKAVRRRLKEKSGAISLSAQAAAVDSNAGAITSGEQV
jgi:hypothetical protein